MGIAFFSFPSHSRTVGMDFFHSFSFPNLLFHRRESKQEFDYCERPHFFSFLYISQNNYIEEVNLKMFKNEWLKRQDILLSLVANSFAAKVLVIVKKIILFWFLFINSAITTTRRQGIIKNGGGLGWECWGQNSFSHHIFAKYFSFIVMLCFFIPVPVPGYSWEW